MPGEMVHHFDHDKANNDPQNIIVVPNDAHHKVFHRTRVWKQLPNEPNETVACLCGCGENFRKFDRFKRPRRYAWGHNRNENGQWTR